MRIHSQKYDDIMKAKKDELRKKRGALELNSDLDMVDRDGQTGDNQGQGLMFQKSKLHRELIKKEKEAKEN